MRIVYMSGMSKPAQHRSPVLPILMIALVAVAGVAIWRIAGSGPANSAGSSVNIGGPFTLTDQSGLTVTDKSYDGEYRLIYFGYTFCPDACPTELGIMAQAI